MSSKRAADQQASIALRSRTAEPKRARLGADAISHSNDTISEDPALHSNVGVSDQTQQSTSKSSTSSVPSDSAADGSSSDSSVDDSGSSGDEVDEQEEVTCIGQPKKPAISKTGAMGGADDLRSRLTSFLPQLEQANRSLEEQGGAHNMEDVEDGEQHIEMDLGLGVLEERRQKGQGSSTSSDSEGDSESDQESDEDALVQSGEVAEKSPHAERDVMAKLLGQRNNATKAVIEDLG